MSYSFPLEKELPSSLPGSVRVLTLTPALKILFKETRCVSRAVFQNTKTILLDFHERICDKFCCLMIFGLSGVTE